MNPKLFLFFVFICLANPLLAQEDSLRVKTDKVLLEKTPQETKPYNALAPAKAAFFSAVLPGLGQAYNGKYWKIPIVYAALGTGIYFYIDNNNAYHRYRDAYKRRLAGYEDDEFQGLLSNATLIEAQKQAQRQKELSLLITVGIYVLNIIDANVDAHLQQFNVNEDLSFEPAINRNEITGAHDYGLSLNFNF